MDNTNTLELRDEQEFPDDGVLKRVLGDSYGTYRDLLDLFLKHELTHEWRYYRDGKAWLCKVQKKGRTIVWMSVWKGFMKTTIYFPLKYLPDVYALDISEQRKETIRNTADVGKSKPCTFELHDNEPFPDLEAVVRLKISKK